MANNTPTPKELADWLTHAGAVATGKVRRNYDAIIEALLSMQPDPATKAASRAAIDNCGCAHCLDNNWIAVTPRPSSRRMVVCSICKNKRCPHAAYHGNACTGSNAPGQEGSEDHIADAGKMVHTNDTLEVPTPTKPPYAPNWNLLYNELDCTRLSGDIVADAAKEIRELRDKLAAAEGEVGRLDASESETISDRDTAEKLMDRITSVLLQEPIDWPYHDEKWREALERAESLTAELAALRASHAPFVGDGATNLKAGVWAYQIIVGGDVRRGLRESDGNRSGFAGTSYQYIGPLPTWGVE